MAGKIRAAGRVIKTCRLSEEKRKRTSRKKSGDAGNGNRNQQVTCTTALRLCRISASREARSGGKKVALVKNREVRQRKKGQEKGVRGGLSDETWKKAAIQGETAQEPWKTLEPQ